MKSSLKKKNQMNVQQFKEDAYGCLFLNEDYRVISSQKTENKFLPREKTRCHQMQDHTRAIGHPIKRHMSYAFRKHNKMKY